MRTGGGILGSRFVGFVTAFGEDPVVGAVGGFHNENFTVVGRDGDDAGDQTRAVA